MVNTLMHDQGTVDGEHRLAIYYEDTDFSGIVYHANYLKYFERAREHLIGMKLLKEWYESGIHFVVGEAHLKFRRPAQHTDELIIRTRIHFSKSPVIKCEHQAFKSTDLEQALVLGTVNLVTLNQDHKPIRLPDVVIDRFGQIEKRR